MIHRCTDALALATSVAFAQGAIAADAQKGNILYNQKYGCFQCHGTVGQGSQITSGGRVLSHTKLPYEAFAAFIRNANGAMPPYREQVLPNEDLADIYAYLQSVPADPDYKTIPLLKD
jgi:mono/diheme cytochrome c family protein